MMLKDKVAVVYGAGGAIGGAVARAFASEGASLFVTGRRRAPVDEVARDIVSAGGSAEAATIDALDEPAVARHLQYVTDRARGDESHGDADKALSSRERLGRAPRRTPRRR